MSLRTSLLSASVPAIPRRFSLEESLKKNWELLEQKKLDITSYKHAQRNLILQLALDGAPARQILDSLRGDKEGCIAELISTAVDGTPTQAAIMRLDDEMKAAKAKEENLREQLSHIHGRLAEMEEELARERAKMQMSVDLAAKLASIVEEIRQINLRAKDDLNGMNSAASPEEVVKELSEKLNNHHNAIAEKLDTYRRLGGKISDEALVGSTDINLSVITSIEENRRGKEVLVEKLGIAQRIVGVLPLGSLLKYTLASGLFSAPAVAAAKEDKKCTAFMDAGYRKLPGA